jgi:cellulose synthase/poly-beta-1,6-N-acetylglucosamine synthase-like glycosyltransferase
MAIESKPKILIVTPTADHKDYCLKDWAESIRNLSYDNLDMLVIDNSKDKNHINEFSKYKFRPKTFITHIERTEKHSDIRHLMKDCNNFGNAFAIKNGYDYILSIESDVFAPCKNAVQILLSHKKEVVGFDYFIAQYHKSTPVVFTRISESSYFTNDVQGTLKSGFLLHDGKLKRVPNLGLGFILIRRSVFIETPFRIDDSEWRISCNNFAHADTFFHIDLQKKGVPTWCDTRYMCEHRNQNWNDVLQKETQ